ncbi:hypothetical protein [Streptomyces palmae]|uniref:Uncharacterized protein n=1 Tax=Streptomyces palmae TaxID=1701085 RepID=A0A4Z0HA11_9ACTN|nr:hypothetical protein [Streptomyces palmae]TGB07500.1 hypothetical protein E4099_16985 [Streptomyces palmae]
MVSVRQYAAGWPALKAPSAGTLEPYGRMMRLHVVPHPGSTTMAQVTAPDVVDLSARRRMDVLLEDLSDGNLRLCRQVVRVENTSGKHAVMHAPLKHCKESEWHDIPAAAILDPLSAPLPVLNAKGEMTHTGLVRTSWDRAIQQLGLPACNPHDLR